MSQSGVLLFDAPDQFAERQIALAADDRIHAQRADESTPRTPGSDRIRRRR